MLDDYGMPVRDHTLYMLLLSLRPTFDSKLLLNLLEVVGILGVDGACSCLERHGDGIVEGGGCKRER